MKVFNAKTMFSFLVPGLLLMPMTPGPQSESDQFWMKIRATDKFERSVIADLGVAIEKIDDKFVIATGNREELERVQKLGWLEQSGSVANMVGTRDFPEKDAPYHNYTELKVELDKLQTEYPNLVSVFSIGKTVEGRDVWGGRITSDLTTADTKPAIIFMGGHHAREHLSVEMPLRLMQNLLKEYAAGNVRVKSLIDSRDIHVIPAVNPDGLEYDIASGRYQMWRKNRRENSNRSYGVDLNRNYGFKWGTGGSSASPNSDTFKGPVPFSEPETQNIKNYVEAHPNINILLSFHTYSKLILYPWGHSHDKVPDLRDRQVFETMGKTMAKWNGYKPQSASDLYIASGDTVDWAYGEHKIIAFTFELDPSNGLMSAGFYPGAKIIEEVVQKNMEPAMYLIDHADDPYRVLAK